MNQEERNKLATIIAATAVYYNRSDLNRHVISMYIEDLIASGLSFDEAAKGYSLYRRNPKNRVFPIPAQVVEAIRPGVDDDHIARETAARINEAVAKFGWARGEDAKGYIGELGWRAIRANGGWQAVCENHGRHIDVGIFTAQTRDHIKSIMVLARHDRLNEAFALPEPETKRDPSENQANKNELTSAAEVIALIQRGNDGR